MLPGVSFATQKGNHPHEQTWRNPAVTVIAQEACRSRGRPTRCCRRRALVSCRIVPDQDPQDVFERMRDTLSADPLGVSR